MTSRTSRHFLSSLKFDTLARESMARGGKRPGSGLPKGYKFKQTLEKDEARRQLREMVFKELPNIIPPHLQHAKGIRHTFMRDENGRFVQLTDPKQIADALNSGDEGKYYWTFTKDPSTQSLAYLLDQALDKAPQSVAVTGPEGGPIVVKWEE